MRFRPRFSLCVTLLWLLFWLWPPLLLHSRALLALAEQPSLRHYVSPLSEVGLALLGRTLLLCMGVMAGTLLLGIPLGFALARGPRGWRMLAAPFCVMALAIPPALAASPFVVWTTASGSATDGGLLSYLLTIATLSGCYAPLVAGGTWLGVAAVSPQEEESALLLGPDWRAWCGVLAAAPWRGARAGALAAGAMTLWEMGAPDLLGWPSFSMHVYRNLAAVDANAVQSAALSSSMNAALVAFPVQLLALLLLLPLLRARGLPSGSAGFHMAGPTATGRLMAWPASVVLLFFPISLLATFANESGSLAQAYSTVAANREAVANTLLFPGLAALLLPPATLLLALGWRSWPATWRKVALALACWPLLVTPVVLGVSLVEAWNQPLLGPLYDSALFMTLVGYGARIGPLCLLVSHWCVGQIDEAQVWAAQGLGATEPTATRTIVLPQLRGPLAGLGALVYALASGELTITLLVQAPGGATLPLPIFGLLHAGLSADVASLCLVLSLLSGSALLLAALLLGRRQ